MGFLIMSGLVMTCAILVTLGRVVAFRLILGYATIIDISFTMLLLSLYAGTYTGMFSATVAGLMLACLLSIGRFCIGYDKLIIRRVGWRQGWLSIGVRRYESKLIRSIKDAVETK